MNDPARMAILSSTESEERFREIFFAHLQAAGFSESDAFHSIFKTPELFHRPPSDATGRALLEEFQAHYAGQLPYAWYFDGVAHRPEPWEDSRARTSKPITFVVIPGIFGEFIEQLTFQSIVDAEDTLYASKWRRSLEETQDEHYQVSELESQSCSLADVVKIGSLDEDGQSLFNVVALKAVAGSLETLGTLESNAEVFRRRLAKVFEIIKPEADIYLVGYSRGLPVALELISSMHEDDTHGRLSQAEQRWFAKLKGLVGLGGVYYGAMFASDVLNGKAGPTSDLIDLIQATATNLQVVPDDAPAKQKKDIVAANTRIWTQFAKTLAAATKSRSSVVSEFLDHDLQEVYRRELKIRKQKHKLHAPNALGIFSLIQNFLLKTFEVHHLVKRYNGNIRSFQRLVESLVASLHTLTPESRDDWWRSHSLPSDLILFSITGSMPDAVMNDFQSPLWRSEGFGATTSDFNAALRSSYYSTIASEHTMINDSQVSHFRSRYWEQMYPEHRYVHYYLGNLGTHHWGMAFPFAIKDSSKAKNVFPRDVMLKSVASFISSLDSSESRVG